MPACDRVKEMNTPIAYSGIRLLMLALNATSSAVAAPARVRMPLENTSLWPRRVNWRGMNASPTLVPNSSGGVDEVEAGEVAGAGAVQGVAVPPGIQADQVEGDCGEHVLEVGLGQPAVAGVADAGDRDGLADGALDPGAEGVARLPGSGALRGAGGLEGVMEAAGADGELPPATLGGGAPGADRARPADRGGELHHDRVGAPLGAGTPPGAQVALRAGRLLGVEVDGERRRPETVGGPGLRGGVGQQRGDEQLDRRVAGVDVVLAGEQVPLGEVLVDRLGHLRVGHGRVGGRHVGDQVGPLDGRRLLAVGAAGQVRVAGVAGLGEVHLVAVPEAVPLDTPAGVGVVR